MRKSDDERADKRDNERAEQRADKRDNERAEQRAAAAPGLRIDPVLVGAAGLCAGALAAVARQATLLTACACLGLLALWLSRRGLFAALICVALGFVRAELELGEFARAHERAREFFSEPRRCAFTGRVVDSPSVLGNNQRFDGELYGLDCEGLGHPGPLRARLYGGASGLRRGDEIWGVADLAPTSWFRNFDLPDPRPGAAQKAALVSGKLHALDVTHEARGLLAAIDALRARVRGRIDANFAPSVRGMARALVLGENDLSLEDDAAFRKSGLSHLLAVSGTHLILAVLALVRAARAVLVRWNWLARRCDVARLSALAGLVLAPLYADFAGGSGSAWRAAFMLVAALGVQALGRRAFPSRVLAASLFAGWLCDGLVIFDLSFLLSIGATVGLSLAGGSAATPTPAELTEPRRVDVLRLGRLISDGALTTLSATLPCLPILLLLAPGVTLASVAANLLAAPLGELVALPLCLLFTLLEAVPPLEHGVALVASGALWLIRSVSHASAKVTFLQFELPPPGCFHMAVLAIGASGALALCGRAWRAHVRAREAPRAQRLWLWLAGCALALWGVEQLVARAHAQDTLRSRGTLRITALDVGQGDATLVDLPDGRLMLIDAGGFVGSAVDPGQRVVLPTLRARRRERLDIVVLTHPHPDHFGGLASVVEHVEVGEFWYGGGERSGPRSARGTGPHARLLSNLERRGVPLRSARDLCDRELGTAGYSLQLLAPCPGPDPAQSANDNSLVLKLRWGKHAALLTGDAEHWAEQRLIATRAQSLRADFLKVGHHGSRSSSSREFLAAVQPSVASISCGLRNRFGHPHPQTLDTLKQAGVLSLRLDHAGAVQWQTDGSTQSLRTADATALGAPN